MCKRPHLYNSLDVAMAFSEVDVSEFSSTFPVLDVSFKHGARTFPLRPDHTAHSASCIHNTTHTITQQDTAGSELRPPSTSRPHSHFQHIELTHLSRGS